MSVTEQGHLAAMARTGIAGGAGVLAGVVTGLTGPWEVAPLVGWDVLALVYLGSVWALIGRMGAERTADHAVREDPTRAVADTLLLTAAVASLVALVLVLLHAGHSTGAAQALQIALGITSVVLSWALVHTTFTLRYARLYYSGTDGGVDFNQDEPPAYPDFAYLAFTIGMTFQVSDTPLGSREIRTTALRHALLSYLFGTVIIAMTINLIAGLGR